MGVSDTSPQWFCSNTDTHRPGAELTTAEDKAIWWNRHYHENKGALHTVEWTRVVLDEAQAIKSVDSQTSIACRSLSAEFRWAMSGTPVCSIAHLNSLFTA